ncbi:MAG: T9SS type A sorting domain-containing protein [Paludibacter sp.]
MNYSIKQLIYLFVAIANIVQSYGQSAWPSTTWSNATNISSALPANTPELSGLYWNNDTNRLYCIGDGGAIYILQYNIITNQYTILGSNTSIGGPEGITQVNNAANEFYTIDENNYEIRKYTYDNNFSSITKSKKWNILLLPSPMTDTGNTGPEGIAFVPDSYLQKKGFVSSVTGLATNSAKGMGGLIFIAHQDGGYIWVFDVNPNVNNDFAYVGKYKTNRSESCDLAFDRSTGLLYVLHNIDDNYLEVTDLTTSIVSGEYKMKTVKEYFIPNPSGSNNIEGLAISPKYPLNTSYGAWLCRDVSNAPETADALSWFYPFTAEGSDIRTEVPDIINAVDDYSIFPNPIHDELTVSSFQSDAKLYSVQVCSTIGKLLVEKDNINFPVTINLKHLKSGIYLLKILSNNELKAIKTLIKK